MPEMNHEDGGGQGPLPGNADSPTSSADPATATVASGDTGSGDIEGTAADGAARQHAADETQAVTGDAASQGGDLHAASGTAGESAAKAGILALKAMWDQGGTLVPLLGVFSYGLGRLMVDGFYGQLHTTAEAAGLGYAAILEPAAIFTAILVVIGTAFTMLFDALRVLGRWIWQRGKKHIAFGAALIVLAGGFAALVALEPAIAGKLLLASGSLTALRTLVDKFGRTKDRRAGETRAEGDQRLGGKQDARRTRIRDVQRTRIKTVTSVILSLGFLLALCFAAHTIGKDEGSKAASGKAVNVRILGLDISSMTAVPVHLQPIVSSTALNQLNSSSCLLKIGSAPGTVLLYKSADQSTLAIPASQAIVVNTNPLCKK